MNQDTAASRHAETVKFLHEALVENDNLKKKMCKLEAKLSECMEMQQLSEEGRARMKDVQEACLEQVDNFQLGLAKKHQEELMEKIEENLNLEMQWQIEKRELLQKIDELTLSLSRLQNELDASGSYKNQIEELASQLKSSQLKLQEQTDRVGELEESNRNKTSEYERLSGVDRSNSTLSDELVAAQQQVKELGFTATKLERLLAFAKDENAEIANSASLQEEQHSNDRANFETKISELEGLLYRTEVESAELRRKLDAAAQDARSAREELDRVKEILVGYQNSEAKADGTGFGDFVKLKRKMVSLEEENERLKESLRLKCQGGNSVHMLKMTDSKPQLRADGTCGNKSNALLKTRAQNQR